METIEVYVCEPGNKQHYKTISNDIKEMQEIVGGFIQIVTIPQLKKHNIYLVCDEEAGIKEKERSIWIDVTWILGTCFFVKQKRNQFATLSEKDKKEIQQYMSGETTMTDTEIIGHLLNQKKML